MPTENIQDTLEFVKNFDYTPQNILTIVNEKINYDDRPSRIFRRRVVELSKTIPEQPDSDLAKILAWNVLKSQMPRDLVVAAAIVTDAFSSTDELAALDKIYSNLQLMNRHDHMNLNNSICLEKNPTPEFLNKNFHINEKSLSENNKTDNQERILEMLTNINNTLTMSNTKTFANVAVAEKPNFEKLPNDQGFRPPIRNFQNFHHQCGK